MVVTFVACLLIVWCAADSSAKVTAVWAANASDFETTQALAVSPDGKHFIFGGDSNSAVGLTATGVWLWNDSYVDVQAEIEGPFVFANSDVVGALAPNSGTAQTLWGIDVTNGNITWSTFDDGSLDQTAFTGIDGAFYSGCVSATGLVRVEAATGKITWKVSYSDFVNAVEVDRRRPNVFAAIGASAASYTRQTGARIWRNQNLPIQPWSIVYDNTTDLVFYSGSNDPTGTQLEYTTVFAYHPQNGKVAWVKNITPAQNATLLAVEGTLVFTDSSTDTPTISAYDALTGASLWSYQAAPVTSNSLAAVGPGPISGTVVFSETLQELVLVNASTGKVLQNVSFPMDYGQINSQPVAVRSPSPMVLVASQSDSEHIWVTAWAGW